MIYVLVIDDEPAIREVIVYALGDEGYQVDEAPNGQVALEIIEQRHPDIILLDMKMPGMDGWEFVRRYRAKYGQRAPIIILTAARDAAQRAAAVDAESVVSKPFDLEMLIQRVADLTQGHPQRSANQGYEL